MDVIAGLGIAWVYSIGFLLLGFTLLLLEIFVIPGLNIFGLLGLLAVSTGVYIAYLKMGLVEAVIISVVGISITLVLLRSVIKSRGWRSLVLSNSVSRVPGDAPMI